MPIAAAEPGGAAEPGLLGEFNAEELGEFGVARFGGGMLAVDQDGGRGAVAAVEAFDDFGGFFVLVDVDAAVGDVVLVEEADGAAAVAAPFGGVDEDVGGLFFGHVLSVPRRG